MGIVVQKWGNSQGIRIPKYILEEVGLKINDEVEFDKSKDTIIIKKVKKDSYITLKERLENFYNKSIEEIQAIDNNEELEWGKAEGEEIEW